MLEKENLYKSILLKIGSIPDDYLKQVDTYLKGLIEKASVEREENRQNILGLAGGWSDMGEEDFEDYLKRAKDTSIIENRDIGI